MPSLLFRMREVQSEGAWDCLAAVTEIKEGEEGGEGKGEGKGETEKEEDEEEEEEEGEAL